jgi:hypothetical protein
VIPEAMMETLQRLKVMTIENGCTPAEAEAAAGYLKAMLDKHQLSIADVSEKKLGEEVIRTEQKTVGDYIRIPVHIQNYAACIAVGYSCKLLLGGGRDGNFKMSFIGLQSDATVAAFFFETTLQPVINEARKQGKANGYGGVDLRHYSEAFVAACGAAIAKRLKPVAGDTSGVAALVPIKQQKIDDFCKEEFGHLKVSTLKTRTNKGTRDGRVYGEQMPLQSGIDTSNTKARALA